MTESAVRADATIGELAAAVVAAAVARGVRLAVAESLTGGAVAAAIVSVPGASRAFSGAIVAYDTDLKASLLGVDPALLRAGGPVAAEVARQMASGVREACAVTETRRPAELGVATTGVAGPDPDPQTGQPAGTVWLGLSHAAGSTAHLLHLSGGRDEIRRETVRAALVVVLAALSGEPSPADEPAKSGSAGAVSEDFPHDS